MDFMDIVVEYGAESAIIAFVAIFLVGVFKLAFKKKLEKIDKANRKPIYETLSLVLVYGLVAVWIYAKATIIKAPNAVFDWNIVMSKGSLAYVTVKVMYPIYENYRIRDLVALAGRGLLSMFKKKVNEKEKDEKTSKPIVL